MSSEQNYTLPLEQASEVAQAGGKAINLGALLRAGFTVPGGFVVTTTAFRASVFSPADVEAAIREAYRGLSSAQNVSPAVAVRSSATAEDMAGASMAGQYETYLDIRGEDGVVEAVRKCWGSLSTPRTQAYLQQHNIDPANVAMAVAVQRLIPAAVAGVMFTVNPRTGDEEEILIEASWGLGETVVSGLVQPDTIILEKRSGKVKSYLVGTKEIWIEAGNHAHQSVPPERRAARCLSEEQLRQLHELALKAHAHFEGPQDTEWAFSREVSPGAPAGGALYLLQSRAVTTLASAKARAAAIDETRQNLRAWKSQGRGDWARHNLGETLGQPTPLTWSVLQRFMTPAGGFGGMYKMAGYEPSNKLNPDGFLDLIAGRIYMDLPRAGEMFFEHFPFQYDPELLRTTPSAAQAAPTLPTGSLVAQFRTGRRLTKAGRHLARLAEDFDHLLDQQLIPAFKQWTAEEMQRDLTALTPEAWIQVWRLRETTIMDEFAPRSLLPSLICGMVLEDLKTFLTPRLWQPGQSVGQGGADPEELTNFLAAGGPPDATLRSNEALYRVARGEVSLETWLQEYGHRAPEEFDLATPRWRERPAAVTALAQHLVHGASPLEEHQQRTREAQTRIDEIKKTLPPADARELDRFVAVCHRYLRFREDGKHELMRGYELLRHMVLDGAQRLQVPSQDVCLLTLPELTAALLDAAPTEDRKAAIEKRIAPRRLRRTAESRLFLPDFISAAEFDTLGEVRVPAHLDKLEAFALSTGAAAGPVRIVHSPESAGDLGKGYVLVCRSTDPSWTPLFVNAAGIVLECGGSLSHGAVVAREMGKPAVVLPGATQILTEGRQITVDGHHGAVFLGDGKTRAAAASPEMPDATDTRVAWDQIPPAPGPRERSAARLRNIAGLFWLLFLVLVFLVPATGLRELSLTALDKILWPVFRHAGGLATVAAVAAGIAFLSMLGQWALTDTVRLREAKRRATSLKKQAVSYPADSPRRKKLLSLTTPVQGRVTLAAFVPLALLLGPMVMSFLWLPERIDPASANPRPGATALVTALVDSDYAGPVTLSVAPEGAQGGTLAAPADPVQIAVPIRPALAALAKQLESGEIPASIAPRLEQTGKKTDALLAELRKFLAAPLPPQPLSWSLPTPETGPDVYTILARAGDAEHLHPTIAMLVLGNAAPPPPNIETDDKGNRIQTVTGDPTSPIRALRIRYTDARRPTPAPFFAPFAGLGWPYDFGWLGAYLLIYIAVLFPTKWLLRVP